MTEVSAIGWEVESYVLDEGIRDNNGEIIIKPHYVYVIRRERGQERYSR